MKMYQDTLNDLKVQGYSDSTREGINRTRRMISRKARANQEGKLLWIKR